MLSIGWNQELLEQRQQLVRITMLFELLAVTSFDKLAK